MHEVLQSTPKVAPIPPCRSTSPAGSGREESFGGPGKGKEDAMCVWAGGVKGKLPEHLFWIFLEMQRSMCAALGLCEEP